MPNKFPSWEGWRASAGVVYSMPELIPNGKSQKQSEFQATINHFQLQNIWRSNLQTLNHPKQKIRQFSTPAHSKSAALPTT